MEVWFANLTLWLKEALSAPFTWLHYQQATVLLEAHGQFPDFQHLKQLQREYHLDINVTQIAKDVHSFFRDETLDLENHLQRLEYAIEHKEGSISITPEQFLARLPAYIHVDLQLLLAQCCACKHMTLPFGQVLSIATSALENGCKEITIAVIILGAIPDFIRSADEPIMQTLPLLITPDDLQPLTSMIEIWAKGEHGIIYAIQQQCRKNGVIDPCKFRLGASFISSVNERGLDTNETVLRSIIHAAADVIAERAKDIHSYRLHHFRKSETADSPQLVRESDQGRAWRLMLQKHGAGWRLHYWQIATSEGTLIEFANVCKESEREIY